MKIMVATPVHSEVSIGYLKSILDLQKASYLRGVDLIFEYGVGSALVHDVRNKLANKFLRSNCTHLFFIDSDIVFSPDQFFQVIQFSKNEKYSIYGGVYPKKNVNWEFLYYAFTQGKKDIHNYLGYFTVDYKLENKDTDFSKPIEVGGLGAGFMCIPREVFHTIYSSGTCKSYYSSFSDFDGQILIDSFFDFDINENTKTLLGEDINFCKKALKCDVKIYALPWLIIGHEGRFTYSATFSKVFDLASKRYKDGKPQK